MNKPIGKITITRDKVMSHSLIAADRATHIRIVSVASAATLALVTALVAARANDPASTLVAAAPTVVKAAKATDWTSRDSNRLVR